MNIDDMPAGPELDRLVAEKVMGWTAAPESVATCGAWPNCWTVSKHGHIRNNWFPSTNIDHAWEVVERIRGLSSFKPLLTSAEFDALPDDQQEGGNWVYPWVDVCALLDGDGFECSIYHGAGTEQTLGESHADTAPLAICRAALKAVRG